MSRIIESLSPVPETSKTYKANYNAILENYGFPEKRRGELASRESTYMSLVLKSNVFDKVQLPPQITKEIAAFVPYKTIDSIQLSGGNVRVSLNTKGKEKDLVHIDPVKNDLVTLRWKDRKKGQAIPESKSLSEDASRELAELPNTVAAERAKIIIERNVPIDYVLVKDI